MSHISYYGSLFDLQVCNLRQSVDGSPRYLASIIYYPRMGASRVWETEFQPRGEGSSRIFVVQPDATGGGRWPDWLAALDGVMVEPREPIPAVPQAEIDLGAEVRSIAGMLARVLYLSIP